MELSYLAFNIQVLSVPLVAVLLWQLTRAVPGRFLVDWTVGWVALATALLFLQLTIPAKAHGSPTAERFTFSLYCCLEYVFGFLLWIGCRELTRVTPIRRYIWVLLLPLMFGLLAPWIFPTTDHVYIFHTPIFGMFFLLALMATQGYRANVDSASHPSFGVHVVRGCLLILGLLFVHYGPVTYWSVWMNNGQPFAYMLLSPMYDLLAEVGLAFGMAMLVIERVRDELEAKNRELAAAARTDPLTGLLNRRAFDAMMAEWKDATFSGSVAVVDLNCLKELNDQHGHAAGDAAIQLVARALKAQFRITDPVFRTGGDEFLVILEGGHAAEMTGRMESLDAALKAQRLPGVAVAVDLIVAWGLADFTSPAAIPVAIERADHAMYACKTVRKAVG